MLLSVDTGTTSASNPAAEGSKFSLDSKAPDMTDYQEFLNGEVRYNSLQRQNPGESCQTVR